MITNHSFINNNCKINLFILNIKYNTMIIYSLIIQRIFISSYKYSSLVFTANRRDRVVASEPLIRQSQFQIRLKHLFTAQNFPLLAIAAKMLYY